MRPEVTDLKNAAENVISFYEEKIDSVGAVFDNTQIFDNFQEAFLEDKEEGQKIKTELRNILAQNEHLRKKDFDKITHNVISAQEELETEVKNLLKSYLNQQREMSRTLRENLAEFKAALVKGDLQRVKKFQEMIKEILASQDFRKEEANSKLKEFQKEQQEMAKKLKELLIKGNQLRIKDLKEMFREFMVQHKERLARRKERRKEVDILLGRIKNSTEVSHIET
ncbi:MAG: hypothetical protein PHW04_03290 [Candidatus Wallbacteria bacterium]|nr:hypothetical protein [Candidatus Wallbacteria bacterium]